MKLDVIVMSTVNALHSSTLNNPLLSALNLYLCWTVFARNRDTAVPAERNGTYRHWSVSLWRDPDDVPHCRILSPDKTELAACKVWNSRGVINKEFGCLNTNLYLARSSMTYLGIHLTSKAHSLKRGKTKSKHYQHWQRIIITYCMWPQTVQIHDQLDYDNL